MINLVSRYYSAEGDTSEISGVWVFFAILSDTDSRATFFIEPESSPSIKRRDLILFTFAGRK